MKHRLWLSDAGLTLLRGWAREKRSEREIASYIGITPETLTRWKQRYPPMAEALHTDGDVIDVQVEDALLKKALGYEAVERKVEVSAKGERKEVETVKQVGPDLSAISLWLKKRRPEQWGDRGGQAEKSPENNLFEALKEGGDDFDGISELQSPTTADDDLVESDGVSEERRNPV